MKAKKLFSRPYGLRAKFTITFVLSGLLCGLLFVILYNASSGILERRIERPEFQSSHIHAQAESLQKYVDEHHISSEDLSTLKKWEKRQPIILLELYCDYDLIYSSFYSQHGNSGVFTGEESAETSENATSIILSDKEVTAVLYSDFTYQYYLLSTVLSFIASLALFVAIFLTANGKLIDYICVLNDEVNILEGGDLDYQVSVKGNNELTDLARSMNRMRVSLNEQIKEEQNLHRRNRRLVTEMSHDLRTPLTGIMLYLEILKSHRYESEEELQNYLNKISDKANLLKALSDHLFQYSLENESESKVRPVLFEKAISETVRDFSSELRERGYILTEKLLFNPVYLDTNEEYLKRIFENILSNIQKYAKKEADIFIETIYQENMCGISIINTCSDTMDTSKSTGIGIENIRNMMKKMNGICTVEQTDSTFAISLLFPEK